MRYALILLFFVSLVPYISYSQEPEKKKLRPGGRKERKQQAREQIMNLKDGTLLIRLETRKPTIEALKKQGKNQKASQLEIQVQQEHEHILNAFRLYFDFCNTACFYSHYSPMITERKFEQVRSIRFPEKEIGQSVEYFLVAEFGNLNEDTLKRFSHYSLERTSDHTLKKVPNYYGGPNLGMSALLMMNDRFIQLKDPFPYYVRFCKALPYKRAVKRAVKRLNRKLHKYYIKQSAIIKP
jgi:hypothetical protein